MPAPVYTERLLQLEGAGKSVTYTVPDGKRCVVTFVAARTETDPSAQFVLGVHGCYAWGFICQAGKTSAFDTVRMVAYERETVVGVSIGSDIRAIVTGYVFADPVGKPAEGKPVDPGRGPRPEPMPGQLDF